MNKYQEALNYISSFLSQLRGRGIGKKQSFYKLYIALTTLQELIDKYLGLMGDYEAQADILYETKQELERYKKENNEND